MHRASKLRDRANPLAVGVIGVGNFGSEVVEADPDVVVDATGDPNVAARHADATLRAGMDVVTVSVGTDTVCGSYLAAVADRHDATDSLAYGDQPGEIGELCGWAEMLGFEVVAEKAPRQPMCDGTPDDAIEPHGGIPSFGVHFDPNQVIDITFLDGTKEAVESVASAIPLESGVDRRGRRRPERSLAELPDRFRQTTAAY